MSQKLLEVGRASKIADLAPFLRERRIALGLHQRVVDEAAGLPDGYCGKLELGTRNLGVESLNGLLAVLGLELALVRPDPAVSKLSDAPTASDELLQKLKRARTKRARMAAYARSDKLSAKKRFEIARKAGRASAAARKKRAMIDKAVRNRREAAKARAEVQDQSNDSAPELIAAQVSL